MTRLNFDFELKTLKKFEFGPILAKWKVLMFPNGPHCVAPL
jgi:hypothetical protein